MPRPDRPPRPPSKRTLLVVANQIDEFREALRAFKATLERDDPNYGRIDEARDYLEAAAGRLRCAI
jgi:hypothetical protein